MVTLPIAGIDIELVGIDSGEQFNIKGIIWEIESLLKKLVNNFELHNLFIGEN